MATTKIEWATQTLNDQTGCSHCSPGCHICYAEIMSVRLENMGQKRYEGATNGDLKNPKWTGTVQVDLERRKLLFKRIRNWSKSQRTFYCSMSDLFHESLPITGSALTLLAEEVEKLREGCKVEQVVMFLTKRPKRMRQWQKHHFPDGLPPQIWVGCTVENDMQAKKRISTFYSIKAKVRFLSLEPLIGPVALFHPFIAINIHWIIAGGESGNRGIPGRQMQKAWVTQIRDAAETQNIPFFFKQWGDWTEEGVKTTKKKAGRTLDGKTHSDYPGKPIQITLREVSHG